MRVISTAIAAVAVFLVSGCSPAPPQEPQAAFTTLQRGEAKVRCHDGDDYSIRPVQDITAAGLSNTLILCDRSELVIFYEGEIDSSFAQMMTFIAERPWRYDRRVLFIHSTGGDVEASLQAGEAISRDAWGVFVAREGESSLSRTITPTARCYSACIFILAAARERIVQGQVGIHRIYPSGSSARSRAELAQALESISERAKTYMRQNGVSATIVDDMMSVPSSDIRVLTDEQLDAYGLGRNNAAQLDVERLDLERRCGEEFVTRLHSAEHEIDQTCSGPLRAACMRGRSSCEAAMAGMNSCVNAVNRRYGFPDQLCPDDGPLFYCADGRISKRCTNYD